jgi:drug/metabolite transporter (DMT)-like permease
VPSLPIAALIALAAAASWGGGDFCGGMAVRNSDGSLRSALRVVLLGHAVSFAVLLTLVAWMDGGLRIFAQGSATVWGLCGGLVGGLSLAAFYLSISRGAMGAPAAVSGLLATAIPAVVSSALEGVPGVLRVAGFAAAAVAIWMIAAAPAGDTKSHPRTDVGTMALALTGGVGFGFFMVALRQANSLGVFAPMALARTGSLVACGLVLFALRLAGSADRGSGAETKPWLERTAAAWAMGVALLDTGGNLLFLAATRLGRLDVAAVLASLYPAATILLAAWHLHERPTRRQLAGMAAALAAVVMITL